MKIDLTSKYYLAAFQRVMCRSYNVQFKLLNSRGCENISKILPTLDGFNQQDVSQFNIIIANFLNEDNGLVKPVDFQEFYEEFSQESDKYSKLKKFFAPRIYDSEDFSEENNRLYRDISTTSTYYLPPDGQDPIYCELKQYCRYFQLYYRLYYLAVSSYVNTSEDKNSKMFVFENPVGYYDVSFNVDNDPFTPLVSNIWLKEYKKTDIEIEKGIKKLISTIETINKKKLPFDLSHYLLSQMFAYQKTSLNTIENHIIGGFAGSYSLVGETTIEKGLPSEKVYRLYETLAFVRSEKVRRIVQQVLIEYFLEQEEIKQQEISLQPKKNFFQHVRSFFDKPSEGEHKINSFSDFVSIKFEVVLSEYNNTNKVICKIENKFEYGFIHNQEESDKKETIDIRRLKIDSEQFDFSVYEQPTTLNSEDENSRISTTITTRQHDTLDEVSKVLNETIASYLSKTKRGNQAKMHSRYHSFIQTMRHQLEKIDVNEIDKRYEEITTHALQLSLAKHAVFFKYDAIENFLKMEVVRSNIMYAEDAKDNINLENRISLQIRERFMNLTDEEKEESLSYKCIKQNILISKYSTICDEEDKAKDEVENSIFACKLLAEEDFLSTVNIEELDEKDRIIFPVVSHNRKVGVLYLISDKKRHFQYNDRIRLANFVYNVGVELFETKLFNALTELNKSTAELGLGNDVKKENRFKEDVVKSVASLFNSNAAVILWQEYKTRDYSTFGLLGEKINCCFGKNTNFSKTDLIFERHQHIAPVSIVDIESSNATLFKKLEGTSYKSCIRIPMFDSEKSIIGWILLFDNHKSAISDSLNSEAKLLSQELFNSIETYYKNKNHISFIQGLISHDISSKLRSIYGANSNFKRYSKYIYDISEYNAFNKNCQDIENYTELGRKLLDFFVNETSQAQISKGAAKNMGIKAYCLYVKKDFIKYGDEYKVDVYEAINSVLHSNKQFLNANGISYFIDKQSNWEIPRLWVNHYIFMEIVENLVDNVRKYSIPRTKFSIKLEKVIMGWDIIFENVGKKLPESVEDNTDAVFEFNLKFNKTEGYGNGLYYCREILRQYGCNLYLNYTLEENNINAKYSFKIHLYQGLHQDFNIWQ